MALGLGALVAMFRGTMAGGHLQRFFWSRRTGLWTATDTEGVPPWTTLRLSVVHLHRFFFLGEHTGVDHAVGFWGPLGSFQRLSIGFVKLWLSRRDCDGCVSAFKKRRNPNQKMTEDVPADC